MIPRHHIVRALRRLETGVHHPPVVRAADGHDYVVKLGNQDADFPACELVAALLAPSFNVDVPPCALLRVSSPLRRVLALDPDGRWADIVAELPGGVCFGSQWVEEASPLTAPADTPLDDPESLLRLFAFDVFIENGDRRGHNPNTLVTGRRLFAIDHGQAVSGVQGATDIGGYDHARHLAWPVVEPQRERLRMLAGNDPSDRAIDDAVDAVPLPWWATTDRREFARQALRDRRPRWRAKLLELSRS